MTNAILSENKYASFLATAFAEAMEYMEDDTAAPADVEKFVKLHLDDFTEMVADYVAERAI